MASLNRKEQAIAAYILEHPQQVVRMGITELAEQSGLTCVPVPAEEVGRQAVALLMRRLSGEAVPEVTLLEPHLTVRDTSAGR